MFRDLSALVQKHPEIKVVTFNSEGIFTNAPVDTAAVKAFVASRNDMNYPIFIDTHRVAVNCTCHIVRRGPSFLVSQFSACFPDKTCLVDRLLLFPEPSFLGGEDKEGS